MLREVHPSVTSRNLLLPVQVLKVAIPELVCPNEPPGLCVPDVLQLVEPLLNAHPPHTSQCSQ